MKVIAINGSPNPKGNTAQALKIVCSELESKGIETEIICVGNKKIRSCLGCGACARNKDNRCIIDDEVNEYYLKMKEADGIILGSPVHYSGISGTMKCFLDRAFQVSGANGKTFRHKVGASIAAVRRTGGMPTIDQLNYYLMYSEMVIPTANYWNVIHGTTPGEIEQDKEGMQIMRVLGKNMAWLIQVIDYSKDKITPPEKEDKTVTNFIR